MQAVEWAHVARRLGYTVRSTAAEDDMARTNQSGSGGAAMAGGERFQARVTAWWAARILLRTPIGTRFALPTVAVAERLYCESGDNVDDVRIELSAGSRIYGQCKRSIAVEKAANSKWADVLLQFARQFESDAESTAERRYVLFYEQQNGTLRRLAVLLDRYRTLAESDTLKAATKNTPEEEDASNLLSLLDTLQVQHPLEALGASRQKLLRRMCIVQFNLADGEADFLSVQDALQHALLVEHTQCAEAMRSLRELGHDLSPNRGSYDRTALRDRLVGEGISLRESIDYRRDFERLGRITEEELAAHEHEGRARLILGGRTVALDRPVAGEILEVARTSSLLVVGEAGAGKTGCLVRVARSLQQSGHRTWYWAADSHQASSLRAMEADIQLANTWLGIFSEARAAGGATLIIDGLDGVREPSARDAYQKLIACARRAGICVVTSIRRFDALYSHSLQALFPRLVADSNAVERSTHVDTTLGSAVSAVSVDELGDSELEEALQQLPEVQHALELAPGLRPVIRNLFNLSLLCQVLAAGQDPSTLSGISTQAGLFERFWRWRVEDDHLHHELASALTALVEQMIEEESLLVVPRSVPAPASHVLLSAGLIRHPPARPGRVPDKRRVEFVHHLLFDYAAERLFVRERRGELPSALFENKPWTLMLRPSLRLHLRYLWTEGRDDFWELLYELERKNVSGVHRVLAHAVVAEEACSLKDLEQLVQRAQGTEEDATHWRRVVRVVVNTAAFFVLPRHFERGTGTWWLHFACDLICTAQAELVSAGRYILFCATERLDHLRPEEQHLVNVAACALVRFYRAREPVDHAALEALKWVCQTFDAAPQATDTLVHELLTSPELSEYMLLRGLVEHADRIAANDPELARAVYETSFKAGAPEDNDRSQKGPNGHRRLVDLAQEHLAKHLPSFLQQAPGEATRALLSAIRWYTTQDLRPRFSRSATDKLRVVSQAQFIHDDGMYLAGASRMLQQWRKSLAELPHSTDGAAVFEEIWSVLKSRNEFGMVWKSLLAAAREAEEFFWPKIWPLLCEPAILFGRRTCEDAVQSLRSAAHVLTQAELGQIEAAILEPEAPTKTAKNARVPNLERAQAELLRQIPVEWLGKSATQHLALLGGVEGPLVHDEGPRIMPRVSRALLKPHARRESASEASPFATICAELEAFCTDGDSPLAPAVVFDAVQRAKEFLVAEAPPGDQQVAAVRRRITYALSELVWSKASLSDEQRAVCATDFEQMLFAPLDVPFEQEDAVEDESGELRWYIYDEQVNAARGFVGLAARPARFEALRAILGHIREHPRHEVRLQLAMRLWEFFGAAPDFVWETLEAWVRGPWSRRSMGEVLDSALQQGWLWSLRQEDTQRADQLLHELLKVAHEHAADQLWRTIGVYLGIWHAEAALTPVLHADLEGLIADARAHAEELLSALDAVLSVVIPHDGPSSNYELTSDPAAVERCCKLAVRILDALHAERIKYEQELPRQQVDGAPAKPPAWLDPCSRVALDFRAAAVAWVRTIAPELASDLPPQADDDAQDDVADAGSAASSLESKAGEGVPRAALMTGWWDRTRPLLEALLRWPLTQAVTDLVEALSVWARLDAPEALFWLHRVIKASAEAGTRDERPAVHTALDTLARLMAQDSSGLASDAAYRANFLQTLDLFLDVGWPQAVELALQLDTLSRRKQAATV